MSLISQLSDEQRQSIAAWVEGGDQLPDIQRKLDSELGHKLTYLDTRFLIEDLGLEIKVDEAPVDPAGEATSPEEVSPEEESGDGVSDEASPDLPDDSPPASGEEDVPDAADVSASVTIDQIQRPGAIMSGKVTFGPDQTLSWWLDQMGQLGIDPGEGDFRPNEQQLMAFQRELQTAVQKQGGGF